MRSQLYLWEDLRKEMKKELTYIYKFYFERIEPVFANAETEADEFAERTWDEAMSAPWDGESDVDPSGIADLLYRTLLEIGTRLVYERCASTVGRSYTENDLVGNMKHLNNNFLFISKTGKDIPKLKESIKANLNSPDIIQILNLYIHYSNPVDEQILLSTWNSMKFYIQACLEK